MRISDWSSDVCSSDLNADITVIGERPKIGPYREQIRTALADMLGVARLQVSVKATTTQALGFEARRQGIAAQAAEIGRVSGWDSACKSASISVVAVSLKKNNLSRAQHERKHTR